MTKVQINSQGKVYVANGKALLSSGSVTPTGKYQLFQRISDDNGNEIGTVSGFFTDANDIEYAVVCLDAQYRLLNDYGWIGTDFFEDITNMPIYTSLNDVLLYANETATENCNLIFNYCAAQGKTSTSVSHCRSKSFVINGTTYYGQLPNLIELLDIFRNLNIINNADASPSSYNNLLLSTSTKNWSSNQGGDGNVWCIYTGKMDKRTNLMEDVITNPVLEIPL